MKAATTSIILLLASLATTPNSFADTFGSGSNQFSIDFSLIGNPGNSPEASSGSGSVPYVFQIGKYEISREMVTKASAAGGLVIAPTLTDMSFVVGGGRPDMPATGITWNMAARFVNWLNTSKGYPVAYKFNTQPGNADYDSNEGIKDWAPTDQGYDPANLFRNKRAYYFLPTVDEWYKAASYDSNANNGVGKYWAFSTGSDNLPTPVASGTAAGTQVYGQTLQQGPADITQAGGLSAYGIMGMGGNAWEMLETPIDLIIEKEFRIIKARVIRGADWRHDATYLGPGGAGLVIDPIGGSTVVGFRVASVPEPNSLLLALIGALGLVVFRRPAA